MPPLPRVSWHCCRCLFKNRLDDGNCVNPVRCSHRKCEFCVVNNPMGESDARGLHPRIPHNIQAASKTPTSTVNTSGLKPSSTRLSLHPTKIYLGHSSSNDEDTSARTPSLLGSFSRSWKYPDTTTRSSVTQSSDDSNGDQRKTYFSSPLGSLDTYANASPRTDQEGTAWSDWPQSQTNIASAQSERYYSGSRTETSRHLPRPQLGRKTPKSKGKDRENHLPLPEQNILLQVHPAHSSPRTSTDHAIHGPDTPITENELSSTFGVRPQQQHMSRIRSQKATVHNKTNDSISAHSAVCSQETKSTTQDRAKSSFNNIELREFPHSAASNVKTTLKQSHLSSATYSEGFQSEISRTIPSTFLLMTLGDNKVRYQIIDIPAEIDDGAFMVIFRNAFCSLRGPFTAAFSPWNFGGVEPTKFRRINACYLEKLGPDCPNDNPEYDTEGYNTSDSNIKNHLWSLYYYNQSSCFRRCSLIKQLPKRKTKFDMDNHTGGEIMWGLDIKLKRSMHRIVIWEIALLTPPVGFWIYWLLAHPGEWDKATTLILVVAALLQIVFLAPLYGATNEK